jgi:hypothetical protein
MGCKKIYSTDLLGIIENTKINILKNFTELESTAIEVVPLEWGNQKDYSNIKEKIDLIICSECLYLEAPWEKLLETILYFSDKDTEIIFAYKKRYVMQEYFIEKFSNFSLKIESYFACSYVSHERFYEEFKNDLDYEIIIAKHKN